MEYQRTHSDEAKSLELSASIQYSLPDVSVIQSFHLTSPRTWGLRACGSSFGRPVYGNFFFRFFKLKISLFLAFTHLCMISLFQSKPVSNVSSKVKESLTCLGSFGSSGFHSELSLVIVVHCWHTCWSSRLFFLWELVLSQLLWLNALKQPHLPDLLRSPRWMHLTV